MQAQYFSEDTGAVARRHPWKHPIHLLQERRSKVTAWLKGWSEHVHMLYTARYRNRWEEGKLALRSEDVEGVWSVFQYSSLFQFHTDLSWSELEN